MFLKSKRYLSKSDEILMQRVQKGDELAFRILYERYNNKMYQYFWRLLGQKNEKAKDFTQDLFLKVVENPERFDIKRSFSAWIYTVAHNMVKNEYRRLDRVSKREGISAQINDTEHIALIDPLDQTIHRKQLLQAIQLLDEKHRDCFVLRYQEDLSVKEVSKILGCPEGTVKSRLFYALKKLSILLDSESCKEIGFGKRK